MSRALRLRGARASLESPQGSGTPSRRLMLSPRLSLRLEGLGPHPPGGPGDPGRRRGAALTAARAQGTQAVRDWGGEADAVRSWRPRNLSRARRFWKSMSAMVMAAFQELSPAQRKSISLRSVVTMVK